MYTIKRKTTKTVTVGNVAIGGNNPISVQSMTNTKTKDIKSTLKQIKDLEDNGCDIVRVSVPDIESVNSIRFIKKEITIPLIADIHFDYKLAIGSIEKGADGIRINPGNIGKMERIKAVVDCAEEHNIPIRIGVNSGSVEKELKVKYQGSLTKAMVESALKNIRLIEDMGYDQIKLSLKGSDVISTIDVYRQISSFSDYPLHLGITEAGTLFSGTIKSSVGLGILLSHGIGDTIRVSLSADPVHEVKAGIQILKSLGLKKGGINIISCPTCSRAEIDVITMAEEIEKRLSILKKDFNVAVMGCVVNGPGEASHADIGIAGGKGIGVIYKGGSIIKKVKPSALVDTLITEITENM